jgi:hypothetical protein
MRSATGCIGFKTAVFAVVSARFRLASPRGFCYRRELDARCRISGFCRVAYKKKSCDGCMLLSARVDVSRRFAPEHALLGLNAHSGAASGKLPGLIAR